MRNRVARSRGVRNCWTRNLLVHSIRVLILAAFAGLALLPAALAQNSARPDLSGIWNRTGSVANEHFLKETPPLQPWAKAAYDENRAGAVGEGHDEMDPTTYCLPLGVPRILSLSNPFEILQAADQVYMLFENQQMQRRIYLDGRTLPESYPLSYMGFATGRYDGDTLVVETTGLSDFAWIDQGGTPHSDALRVTERIRRANPTVLEIDFVFDDPKAFTRPWGAKKTYDLKPDWEIMEHIGYCDDRFRYNFTQKVFKGTVDWQSPEQAAGER